jgi:hypothetical protein
MFKKNGHPFQTFFTEAEVWAIRDSLAELLCSRCGLKYRVHRDADHFFEHVQDVDPAESG